MELHGMNLFRALILTQSQGLGFQQQSEVMIPNTPVMCPL